MGHLWGTEVARGVRKGLSGASITLQCLVELAWRDLAYRRLLKQGSTQYQLKFAPRGREGGSIFSDCRKWTSTPARPVYYWFLVLHARQVRAAAYVQKNKRKRGGTERPGSPVPV